MRALRVASSKPKSWFACAAAHLINPRARINDRGKRYPLIGKFRTARWVEAPKRADSGMDISPIESFSIRVPATLMPAGLAKAVAASSPDAHIRSAYLSFGKQ